MDLREKLIDVFTHLDEHISYKEEYGVLFDTPFCKAVEDVLQILENCVTVQEWIPVSEPPKETGHYLVNIHQEDYEKGESADFVLDAWYQVNGLLFVPDTIG